MPGGLLNLVSYGSGNLILNGNPKKTFFTTAYATYTNFGLQKFRIDFNGLRTLRMNEDSRFTFVIPRYADLLMDTYIVVNLPTIWSPILPPQDCSGVWQPYEFKWIERLGLLMVKSIEFSVGGQIIQKFSGQYLNNQIERDFNGTKRFLISRMTADTPEFNNPAFAFQRNGRYPNAYYTPNVVGPQPSIRGRQLYIPVNIWWTLSSKMAFPLVSLQYNQLQIDVVMRPVRDLFVIRDIEGGTNNYVRPNFADPLQQFYRFLQPPPNVELEYTDTRTNWNADVHLLSTYCFLSSEETRVFAAKDQRYLIKEVYEYDFQNTTGNGTVEIDSLGLVSSWMWYFQRSDAYLRNEWSNYTNWPYKGVQPYPVQAAPMTFAEPDLGVTLTCSGNLLTYGPGLDPFTYSSGLGEISNNLFITGLYNPGNQELILNNWAILLDGKFRENTLAADIYSLVEKYVRTGGAAEDGLYCYNFCLNSSPFDLQPSGAMNMSKFNTIAFQYSTYYPPLDPSAQFLVICDPSSGLPVAVNKPNWIIYDYTYNLHIMEERYNILIFTAGNCGLMYAR